MASNKREMDVEFREDGRILITTGDMSGPHHKSAQEFIDGVAELMGKKPDTKSRKGTMHTHHHHHGEQHGHAH